MADLGVASTNRRPFSPSGSEGHAGRTNYVDMLEQARNVPHDYRGWVVTNRIELTGTALENR